MSLNYLGSMTVGATVQGVDAALAAAKAGLQAQLDAYAGFSATVALPVSAQIALAAAMQTSLQAALAVGIEAPSLEVQVDLMAAAQAVVAAQLQIIADLLDLFTRAGVHAYAYSGRADELGAALASELASGFPGGDPDDATHAIVLATTSNTTWNAMRGVFEVGS